MKSKFSTTARGSWFNLTHLKADSGNTMRHSHHHSWHEIYFVVDGELGYFIKNNIYHVTAGDIILLDRHEIHSAIFSSLDLSEGIVLEFRGSEIYNMLPPEHPFNPLGVFGDGGSVIHLEPGTSAGVESFLMKMLGEGQKDETGADAVIRSLLIQLLVTLARHSENSEISGGATHTIVMQVADYICTNYADDISVGKLSDTFFISPFYLMKIFKKYTGFSIINYLNRVRVKEAAKMLERSAMSITDISAAAGFSNVTHFGRVFRQVMGDSPRSYRSAFRSR
ncbi:MAG TPA: hypothetical protein DCL60_10815 [Armatimonadetes bacterium]|nr:hypothetical protein [Armatimonadota bacterium]